MGANKNQKNKALGTSDDAVPWWTSCRLSLAMMGFVVFLNIFAHRVSMSVAIVSMVNHTEVRMRMDMHTSTRVYVEVSRELPKESLLGDETSIHLTLIKNVNESQNQEFVFQQLEDMKPENNSGIQTFPGSNLNGTQKADRCGVNSHSSNRNLEEGPFAWDKVTQGHILGAFYYGYLVSQLPSGYVASMYGGKVIVMASLLITAISSLLLPMAAYLGPLYVVALRIAVGAGAGAVYPAIMTILSKWAPPTERTKLVGIIFAGGGIGVIVAHPTAAILCKVYSEGWSLVFYVFGCASLVTLVIWWFCVSDHPSLHRCITSAEKEYITYNLRGQVSNGKEVLPIPWLRMLSSPPVWAVFIGMLTTDWGFSVYMSYIPTYMFEVLRFDMRSNGILSSLPFVGHSMVLIICPLVADKILSTGVLSVGNTRKLVHVIGAGGGAVFLVALAFVDCQHPVAAVSLLTMGVTIFACVYSGFPVNIIDLAPTHSGTVLGIANSLSSGTGFISPYVIAFLTPQQSHGEWQRVFFLTAAIYVIGTVCYCVLGSGTIQDWAKQAIVEQDECLYVERKGILQREDSEESERGNLYDTNSEKSRRLSHDCELGQECQEKPLKCDQEC